MEPDRKRLRWPAWLAAVGLVVSPFVLFFDASPLFGAWAILESAAGLALAFVVTVVVCMRQRHFWPLALATALIVTVPAGFLSNLYSNYPCLPYANAPWCGHFCDDDPCMCAYRHLGPAAYGPGSVGCESELGPGPSR